MDLYFGTGKNQVLELYFGTEGVLYTAVAIRADGVLWKEYLEKTDHGFRECTTFVLIFCMPDGVSKLIWILDSCYHDLLATEEQYLPRQVDL